MADRGAAKQTAGAGGMASVLDVDKDIQLMSHGKMVDI